MAGQIGNNRRAVKIFTGVLATGSMRPYSAENSPKPKVYNKISISF